MNQERLLKLILSPHISEKSTIGIEKRNEYVFQVLDSANKSEIKDAIEVLFNTKVKSVRIVNVRPKKRLFRGIEGVKKGWKKAYVTLQADQKLDIMGAQ
jgi:large subunit ribosomal protein L23